MTRRRAGCRRERETAAAFDRGLRDYRDGELPDPGRTQNGRHIDSGYVDGYLHGQATAAVWAELDQTGRQRGERT